ncbi:MAG: SCO family protein [Chloroflexi bacterium]|nr:SCO family protein [Chloroflexota bacterium]
MKRFALPILYGVLAAIVVGALAFKIFQPVQVLPRVRLAPGYAMLDQNGDRLTNESVRGSFVLYTFTYTRCETDACAQIDETMLAVQESLDALELGGIPLRLVTISFDPAHDTPTDLAAYAGQIGADPAVWQFATHSNPDLLKTIIGGGFEVYYTPDEQGGYTFDPTFVLVDGLGIIRGEYRYQTIAPDTDRITRHINVLAEEAHHSTGAATVAYEAAHLFLCYAP